MCSTTSRAHVTRYKCSLITFVSTPVQTSQSDKSKTNLAISEINYLHVENILSQSYTCLHLILCQHSVCIELQNVFH